MAEHGCIKYRNLPQILRNWLIGMTDIPMVMNFLTT